ncbi:MAG: PP2C family protein-serine/threonine phosphatase [Bryobacteraceae bacterium]|nr:PP2C family protein-serine/threonine phosphatase [Bryobacteraceae bacterium]
MTGSSRNGWITSLYRKVGIAEKIFVLLFVLWLVFLLASPAGTIRLFLQFAMFAAGMVVLIRYLRRWVQSAIWRLRNRLYVVYLFIAVVPVCLILILGGLAAYLIASEVSVYLVTSELNRRADSLGNLVEWLARAPAAQRAAFLQNAGNYGRNRFPGLELIIRGSGGGSFPASNKLEPPPGDWPDQNGLVLKDEILYAWAHIRRNDVDVTALVPLTQDYLSELVPNLGEVNYTLAPAETGNPPVPNSGVLFQVDGTNIRAPAPQAGRKSHLGVAVNRFDKEVLWFSLMPAAVWDAPGTTRKVIIAVRTRFSAVRQAISTEATSTERAGTDQNLLFILFTVVTGLFLGVELIALVIGVSLTRTITGAVHNLYEGTQKVMKGEFSHRIEVKGNDQLADLGISFNRMTENLEQLVVVAKEKERLQAELELAREVQAQLYPKVMPTLKTLRIVATCNPARLVSGDYFDYQCLEDTQVALALGDVAGKGISAALLMATVQSSLRTQLRHCLDSAASNGSAPVVVATAEFVAQLNQQLYADTAPEKYATFYFGVYDDTSSLLTYTNAGHLPPIVIRREEVLRLDVNGIVVGAFPFAKYDESQIQLLSGDLLVCYTDGVTEPENEYGEMFGDERLIQVLQKNAGRDEQEIVARVIDSVLEWTGAGELQDDMTLLVARRQ